MRAVIMAGGKGTRLHALTNNIIPKPMAPICGKPILEWQIECLRKNGITEICIVIGHLGEKIRHAFGDGSALGVRLEYFVEEKPLGTAGALGYLSGFIKDEPFMLVYGDCIFDIDIKRMAAFHNEHNAHATLFAHPNSHPFDSDLLIISEDGRVSGILPKNAERSGWYDNMVNAGLYIVSGDICGKIVAGQAVDFEKDYLAEIIPQGIVFGYKSSEYVKDVGTPERIGSVAADIENGVVSARNLSKLQKCVFLDRDGTINPDSGLIHKADDFELFPFAAEAIKKLNSSGFLVIVVTNQSVVARGLCNAAMVDEIHNKMKTLLGTEGAYVDGLYYCPHHPDKGYEGENPAYKIPCECRKPGIGMIQRAVAEFNISCEMSWIIGDTTTDIQTGKNAGMKTALVRTGAGGEDGKYDAAADVVSGDLWEAVGRVLND